MTMTRVRCQACGAELEVGESLRYVSCNECGTGLEVVREASVTHTRPLLGTEAEPGGRAEDLRVIELQNDLERLDREWDVQEESFMVTYKHGRRAVPTTREAILGMVFMVAFAIFWFLPRGSRGATDSPFVLVGILPIGLMSVEMAKRYRKAIDHRHAEVAMESERAELVMALEAAKRSARARRSG